MISMKGLKLSELIHKHLSLKINTAGLHGHIFHTKLVCIFTTGTHDRHLSTLNKLEK